VKKNYNMFACKMPSGTELHVLILQLNKENVYDKRMHFNTRWHIFHVGIIFMIF